MVRFLVKEQNLPFTISMEPLVVGEVGQQLIGHAHEQQLRELPDEQLFHPRRHLVCARLAVVDVEHHDSDYYAEPYQQHGEQQVLAEQRQCQRCGRDYL